MWLIQLESYTTVSRTLKLSINIYIIWCRVEMGSCLYTVYLKDIGLIWFFVCLFFHITDGWFFFSHQDTMFLYYMTLKICLHPRILLCIRLACWSEIALPLSLRNTSSSKKRARKERTERLSITGTMRPCKRGLQLQAEGGFCLGGSPTTIHIYPKMLRCWGSPARDLILTLLPWENLPKISPSLRLLKTALQATIFARWFLPCLPQGHPGVALLCSD